MSTRRQILSATAAGIVTATMPVMIRAASSGRIVLGIIGPGGMGSNHLRHLVSRKDVEIAWVCDVDRQRLDSAADHVQKETGKKPLTTVDLRKVLDDPRVDAVFIATPDHWHAPASILALDAGKHVYVEKPCCHNVREGRLMADAVGRSGKVLQVGTQSRSTEFVAEAMQRIQAGEIGEVLVAKAWNSQRRGSIGKSQPTPVPDHLDFDMWTGPAPRVPYRKNLLHAVWRWWHAFGCGDIGNDGVHDIDVAVWGLGVTEHPVRAACFGGKYFFDDDQQFPDTQYAQFEYSGPGSGKTRQLIFEQRIWSPYTLEGYENGASFYGTNGCLIIGHTTGYRLYGPGNKLLAERTGRADLSAHHQNFLDSIRGTATPSAGIQIGHLSASLVHLANIAARVGRVLNFDPQQEKILSDRQADQMLRRRYEPGHWAVPENTA